MSNFEKFARSAFKLGFRVLVFTFVFTMNEKLAGAVRIWMKGFCRTSF